MFFTCAETMPSLEQDSGLHGLYVLRSVSASSSRHRLPLGKERPLAAVEVTCLRECAGRSAHLRVPTEAAACFCAWRLCSSSQAAARSERRLRTCRCLAARARAPGQQAEQDQNQAEVTCLRASAAFAGTGRPSRRRGQPNTLVPVAYAARHADAA